MGQLATWITKKPPRDWDRKDRVFIWSSTPDREVVGLAELTEILLGTDSEGHTRFRMRYLSRKLKTPIGIDELRRDPAIREASFLKSGPAAVLHRLRQDQGEHLYRLVCDKNAQQVTVWPDVNQTLLSPQGTQLEVDYDEPSASEGAEILRIHRDQERDRSLVEKKKASVLRAFSRLACEVCGFDFNLTYGKRGEGFCEVHHCNPLSLGGERVTTPQDLAIVCSNCHRMLHRGGNLLSIEELKALRNRAGKPTSRSATRRR